MDHALEEVAGFVVSLPGSDDLAKAHATAMKAMEDATPGKATVFASGVQVKTHDRYEAVRGATVDLTLPAADVFTIRNKLVARLLGEAPRGSPGAAGGVHADMVLRFSTVRRFAFARDPKSKKVLLDQKGYPKDSGDAAARRILVMGAVVPRARYKDHRRGAGIMVDDLSNGSGLATFAHGLAARCDTNRAPRRGSVLDVIWLVDEAPSMAPHRPRVVAHAMEFLHRATAAGHDVRVAVAGMDPTQKGAFCDPDGKGGRFLGPTELGLFGACVSDPPGSPARAVASLAAAQAAVKAHLPRAEDHPGRVRPFATLVVIVATNRLAVEVATALKPASHKACTLSDPDRGAVSGAVQPTVDYFAGITDPEAVAMFHIMGGACNSGCGAPVSHGYRAVAQKLGGQWMDICQKKLGSSLQVIVDSVTACSCPLVLSYLPISATLSMASDDQRVPRDRTNGFDYRANSNSMVIIGPSASRGRFWAWSYYRWVLP